MLVGKKKFSNLRGYMDYGSCVCVCSDLSSLSNVATCTFELKGNPKLLMPDGVFQVLPTDIRRELRFKLNISYF